MRLFVAAEIDPAIARDVARAAGELRLRVEALAPRARVTWVPVDRLHFTVRFIGEVDEDRGSAIAAALAAPLPVAPFALTIAGLGAFPPKGPPRVFWAGTGDGRGGMSDLEREVSARLATCGIPSEAREYSPHLTLARVRDAEGLRTREALEVVPQGPFGTTHVDAITLFESRLSPKGPTYVPVQRTAFAGQLKPAQQMEEILAVALAYLVGSVPFAFLLARRRGIDLRRVGSGNVGASNVLRTTGVANAVAAMCLDGAKGWMAVIVAQRLTVGDATAVAAGVASIVGHVYPVWLGFRGGKGVATATGVFVVLAPLALAIASSVFVLAVWVTRYVSVGSLAGAITLVVATAASDVPAAVAVGAVVSALVVVHRHRANLARLLAGTERRVGH